MALSAQTRVVVVGAGAFGGWTALQLQRRGAKVSLIDMAHAGHALSSSGGESRVIRHVYEKRFYVDMAARALALWQQADHKWGQQLFHQKGVLFMSDGGTFVEAAKGHMNDAAIDFENLDRQQLARRWPQINPEGLEQAIYEPAAGYLDANRACAVVRKAFIEAGGQWLSGRVKPGAIRNGEMQGLVLEDGSLLKSDRLVFACGPWLKKLFAGLLGECLSITRQEVYFFRIPKGQVEVLGGAFPVWADIGKNFWYGIPGANGLFKIADDTNGAEVDPDTQGREPSAPGVDSARRYLAYRFPGMANAQLADARVCQYSMTPDHDFILDWHPEAGNVLLMGGGSGHGFKHGPAIAELAAEMVLDYRATPPEFRLGRWQ